MALSDKERIARIEAQFKFITPIIERMDKRIERLVEREAFTRGKLVGLMILVSFTASIIVKLIS